MFAVRWSGAPPPPGFAADMARLVAPAAAAHQDEGRWEKRLLNGLFVAFALGALVVALLYGGQWFALASHALGTGGAQWAQSEGIRRSTGGRSVDGE